MMLMWLEPATSSSRVKHSTTEPVRSLVATHEIYIFHIMGGTGKIHGSQIGAVWCMWNSLQLQKGQLNGGSQLTCAVKHCPGAAGSH